MCPTQHDIQISVSQVVISRDLSSIRLHSTHLRSPGVHGGEARQFLSEISSQWCTWRCHFFHNVLLDVRRPPNRRLFWLWTHFSECNLTSLPPLKSGKPRSVVLPFFTSSLCPLTDIITPIAESLGMYPSIVICCDHPDECQPCPVEGGVAVIAS